MKRNKMEQLSRPTMHRIFSIHERINANEFPNCVGMAAKMEVSVKTLKRDVEFMRDRLNLPIGYDSQRHGYFYTKPVDKFPGVAVTEHEMFAMLVADKAIAQYQGTPFQKPLRIAFEKLKGQLDSDTRFSFQDFSSALSFRPFAPENMDAQVFQSVARSLQEQRVLRFRYRKAGMLTRKEREVHPCHVACIDNRWYLFAHDVGRNALRTFALTRIAEPVVTKERFEKPRFDLNEYLRGSFNVMKGDKDFEVVVEVDAWAADLVRGRKCHPTQEFTELPAGWARIRMRVSGLDEIERWVLNLGTHATVVSPQALRDRVGRMARELAERYGVAGEELRAK